MATLDTMQKIQSHFKSNWQTISWLAGMKLSSGFPKFRWSKSIQIFNFPDKLNIIGTAKPPLWYEPGSESQKKMAFNIDFYESWLAYWIGLREHQEPWLKQHHSAAQNRLSRPFFARPPGYGKSWKVCVVWSSVSPDLSRWICSCYPSWLCSTHPEPWSQWKDLFNPIRNQNSRQ
jgi:hypothetical protein